jgi:hypothetical protein
MTKTTVAVVNDDAVIAAAASAGEQARQKEGRTAQAVQQTRQSHFDDWRGYVVHLIEADRK